ncbi:MAG: DUF1294 domain-containing protein [Candidatus Sumerlaeaceae bacterium]
MIATPIVAAWALLLTLLTFSMYGLDKKAARLGLRRIPESTLLMLGFLGGTVGAITAMLYFRHKTHKRSFQLNFAATTALQIVAIIALFTLPTPLTTRLRPNSAAKPPDTRPATQIQITISDPPKHTPTTSTRRY